MKTLLIDYGSGNIHSCGKALSITGYDVTISTNPVDAKNFDLLVLPGQGHFGQVMQSFLDSGFEDSVREHIAADKPFLGICVGMQILYQGSEEAPGTKGLGLAEGQIRKFEASRVPQMGWNTVDFSEKFGGMSGEYFYFVHSYFAPVGIGSIGITQYEDTAFTAVYAKDNLIAPQFHPEKSGSGGLKLLEAIRKSY